MAHIIANITVEPGKKIPVVFYKAQNGWYRNDHYGLVIDPDKNFCTIKNAGSQTLVVPQFEFEIIHEE